MSNNLGDFSYFKTATGGVLAIPNKWSPSNFVYIDKNYLLNRDEDYVLNVWGSHGGPNSTPYKICKALHPKEDVEECIANAWDIWVSSLSNGGVRMFDADDEEGNRQTYTGCWMSEENGKLLDFDKKYFSGYYPSVDGKNLCYGKPYQIETNRKESSKPGNFEANANVKFQISLPLDK